MFKSLTLLTMIGLQGTCAMLRASATGHFIHNNIVI